MRGNTSDPGAQSPGAKIEPAGPPATPPPGTPSPAPEGTNGATRCLGCLRSRVPDRRTGRQRSPGRSLVPSPTRSTTFSATSARRRLAIRAVAAASSAADPVRHQRRRVRAVVRRFVAQVKRNWSSLRRDVVARQRRADLQRPPRRADHRFVLRPSAVDAFTHAAHNAILASNRHAPLPPEYPDDRAFFTVTSTTTKTPVGTADSLNDRRSIREPAPRSAALAAGRRVHAVSFAGMTGQTLVAILGPTASGKSALDRARRAAQRRLWTRFDRRLPRLRHRNRQGLGRGAQGNTSPSRGRRGSCRGVFRRAERRARRRPSSTLITARGRLLILGRHRFLLSRSREGCFGPGRDAAMRARLAAIAPSRSRAAAPAARLYRSGVRRPYPTAGRSA